MPKKLEKTDKNIAKCQKCKKPGENLQKYRKFVKNVEKC